MNRRTFMQSVAAAFASPILSRIAPVAVYREIDWSLFVDAMPRKSDRFDLASPFVQNGLRIATEARLLIAAPDESGDGESRARVPDCSVLPWREFDSAGWSRLTEQTRILIDQQYPYECPSCFGKGSFGNVRQCDANHDDFEECRLCCNTQFVGDYPCEECGGRGEVYQGIAEVGGCYFEEAKLARIRTIGDVDVRIARQRKEDGGMALLLFQRGDGARGFLASLWDDVVRKR